MSINENNDNNDNNEINNKPKCLSYMPCYRFLVASGVSVGTCVFGCVMLGIGGLSAPLAPFYSSLITGSIFYWCPSPKITNKNN